MLSYMIYDALVGDSDETDWNQVLDRAAAYQQVVSLQSTLVSAGMS
jgi:hypothetical protein